jgi:hypothetical protein
MTEQIVPLDPRCYAMSEDTGPDSLEAKLKELLREYDLFGYHNPDSRRSAAGWPDWEIIGAYGKGALYRELKSQRGTLKVAQRRVGSLLQAAGMDWAVWRPSDYFNGTIRRQLERIVW